MPTLSPAGTIAKLRTGRVDLFRSPSPFPLPAGERVAKRGGRASRVRGTVLVLLASLLVAGCGFQPLYGRGPAGSATDQLAAVRVHPIPDRLGQILSNYLRDELNPLGRPSSPDYVLAVHLKEEAEDVALRHDETATRVNVTVTATFALRPAGGEKPLFQGVSSVTTSYNVLRAPYSTLISSEDVRSRALRDIASDIRTRLATFLQARAAAAP